MPMTKKDFIALADALRERYPHVRDINSPEESDIRSGYDLAIEVIHDKLVSMFTRFNGERWVGYIRGENGPNGGRVDNDGPVPRKRRRAMLLGKDVNESRWDGITNQ